MNGLLSAVQMDELHTIANQLRAQSFGPDAAAIERIVKSAAYAYAQQQNIDRLNATNSPDPTGAIPIVRPGDRFILSRRVYFLAPTPHEIFDTIADAREKQGENQALQIATEAISEDIRDVEPEDVKRVVKALADHWGVVFGINGNV